MPVPRIAMTRRVRGSGIESSHLRKNGKHSPCASRDIAARRVLLVRNSVVRRSRALRATASRRHRCARVNRLGGCTRQRLANASDVIRLEVPAPPPSAAHPDPRHAIAGTPKTRHCTDPCAGQARKQPPAPRLTRKSPRFPRADTAPFHTLIHTLTHSPSTPHVDSAPARRIRGRRQAFFRRTAPRSPPRRASCRSATPPGPCARRHSGDAMISTRRANANAHLDCLSTALWTVDPHLLWMTGAERAASRESCLRSLQPGFELRTTTPGTGPGVSVERSRGLRTSCGPRSPSRRR